VEPDPAVRIDDGNLEKHQGNRAAGFQLQEQPGTIAFADTAGSTAATRRCASRTSRRTSTGTHA